MRRAVTITVMLAATLAVGTGIALLYGAHLQDALVGAAGSIVVSALQYIVLMYLLPRTAKKLRIVCTKLFVSLEQAIWMRAVPFVGNALTQLAPPASVIAHIKARGNRR